ncbi:MAG: amidophosphoribosyltransferase [Clostridia bacterium]|nr:amidophosphoribosyltransferase [Clostridia bacterium]
MGGFFGACRKSDAISDVFFGTDYHSHLGTKRAGMASFSEAIGLQRVIHNIENSPFRTKFENVFEQMEGHSAIGCISDYAPQPLLIRSRLGKYAIATVGVVNNTDELVKKYIESGDGQFDAMTGGAVNTTELVAALVNKKENFTDGIRYAQSEVEGTVAILILKDDGSIIAARDKVGRLPLTVGKSEDGYCATLEPFAASKLDYEPIKELRAGEIVEISADGMSTPYEGSDDMKICSFLWSYYGYPTSTYEGKNVEIMRYKNGAIMAENDKNRGQNDGIDYVGGIPDSGTPHAIGYANKSGIPFARAFIKYTPTWARSFTPAKQSERNRVAKMKQIPVKEIIEGKNLLFVDDSIVRGTQIRETVEFLYESGAKEVHMRSACPPIMYSCKYLNFSRATDDMELITRKIIAELEGDEGIKHIHEYSDFSTERGKRLREKLCEKLHLKTIEFQSLEGIIEAIGLEPCKLCTYCWTGKE